MISAMNDTAKETKEIVKKRWGTHSKFLWTFYKSADQQTEKEYENIKEAMKAQRSMLSRMNDKHIYDVRITRRKNVLYLEKARIKGNEDG